MTLLGALAILVYFALMLYKYANRAPVESHHIKWSSAHGPYPLEVECHEERCWLWLSGCKSPSADQCIEMEESEKKVIKMCYAASPFEGLHMQWTTNTTRGPSHSPSTKRGIHIVSYVMGADNETAMPMTQGVVPGLHLGTYVFTCDATVNPAKSGFERVEWFATFLSLSKLASPSNPCGPLLQGSGNSTEAAQLHMAPEFHDRSYKKKHVLISLVAEVGGGVHAISQLLVFFVYLALWKLFGACNPQDDSVPLPAQNSRSFYMSKHEKGGSFYRQYSSQNS